MPQAGVLAITRRARDEEALMRPIRGYVPPLPLKAKFAIAAGTVILAVASLITAFLTHQQEATIREGLERRAVALTENLAYNCQLPLVTQNTTTLQRLGKGLMGHADVAFVQFHDATGAAIVSVGSDEDSLHLVPESVAKQTHGAHTAWMKGREGVRYLEVVVPVTLEAAQEGDILAANREVGRSENVGSVRVGVTALEAEKRIDATSQLATLLGIAVAVAGSVAAALLIHRIFRPLSQLMEGNRRVARGDFSLRLATRSQDEFGRLAHSWNQMADEIQRSRELANRYFESLRDNAEKLEGMNRTLLRKNEEIARASRMKSEFLAIMSHELRTPLNGIIGFSEVLLDEKFGKLNEKQRRFTENTLTSGRHLLRLINDLLDLSKIEAGKLEVNSQEFELRQSLDEVQVLVRNLSMKKDVQLTCEPIPERLAHTDPKLLKQVMFNLLSNAVKFTPSGGSVQVVARCMEGQELRTEPISHALPGSRRQRIPDSECLLVEVRDTGIGIAAEDHDKIFIPFQQLDSSYARRQEGTGLGLALTRRVVHLLGGEIWFTSQSNEGSCFVFYVPMEYDEGAVGAEPLPLADEGISSESAVATESTGTSAEELAESIVAVRTDPVVEGTEMLLWPWGDGSAPPEEFGVRLREGMRQEKERVSPAVEEAPARAGGGR